MASRLARPNIFDWLPQLLSLATTTTTTMVTQISNNRLSHPQSSRWFLQPVGQIRNEIYLFVVVTLVADATS